MGLFSPGLRLGLPSFAALRLGQMHLHSSIRSREYGRRRRGIGISPARKRWDSEPIRKEAPEGRHTCFRNYVFVPGQGNRAAACFSTRRQSTKEKRLSAAEGRGGRQVKTDAGAECTIPHPSLRSGGGTRHKARVHRNMPHCRSLWVAHSWRISNCGRA
jgi:hypothetical protein